MTRRRPVSSAAGIGRRLVLAAPAAWATGSTPSWAQPAYPVRPPRLVVPFPPGGSNDIMGRLIAQQLTETLGQRVVVENRGGAGGTIGVGTVARAAGDGYTLLLVSLYFAVNPALYATLPYDPVAGFRAVSVVASGPLVLLAHPSTGITSVAQLVERAKAGPGTLRYSSAGIGSAQHLTMEYFKQVAGLDIAHVPYKGGGETMMDVVAGRVELSMSSLAQSVALVKDGRLAALGVTSSKRNELVPSVPAIAETYPGYDAVTWWGLSVPAKVPQPVVDRLHDALDAGFDADTVKARLAAEGAVRLRLGAPQSDAFVADEMRKWAGIAQRAGITPQ